MELSARDSSVYARRLSQFLTLETQKKAAVESMDAASDPFIASVEYDSRNVKKGSLFFALPGLHTDGSLYIEDAIKRGAAAIVHENEINEKKEGIAYIKAKNARYAMSPLSAAFYEYPSCRMITAGVTGTEGKSTTVYLIWQLLTLLGEKAGFISTVQHCLGGEVLPNVEHQTTPEAPVVQRLLYEMAAKGCKYAVVEASSHGLSRLTNRLGDVRFSCAVLTNLTHDHLEFHGTWEQYRDDKANLFRALDNPAAGSRAQEGVSSFEPIGVINGDDRNWKYFAKSTKRKTYLFSAAGRDADLEVEIYESCAYGNWYSCQLPVLNERVEIRDRLPGAFNIRNVLAALLAAGGLLKKPVREIAPFVKFLEPVRGRMTAIEKNQDFEVIVDFAHTPSSFLSVLPPLRNRLDEKGGKIICLFGSAGERDTKKRAEQGIIARAYCDIIILADEDPRGENPMDILEEIAKGVLLENYIYENADVQSIARQKKDFQRGVDLFLIPQRPLAIRKALSLAGKGDLVIFLGKGHENSIIYADKTMPYDEITEAEKALAEMGYK